MLLLLGLAQPGRAATVTWHAENPGCLALLAVAISAPAEELRSAGRCETLIEDGRKILASVPPVEASEFDAEGRPTTTQAHRASSGKARALATWHQAAETCRLASREAERPEVAARYAARAAWVSARALRSEQRWPEAWRVIEDGLADVRKLVGGESPAMIELLEARSEVALRIDDAELGLTALEDALAIRRRAYGADDPKVAPGLIYLASYFSLEDLDAMGAESVAHVESLYQEAIGLVERKGAPRQLVDDVFSAYGDDWRALSDLEKTLFETH